MMHPIVRRALELAKKYPDWSSLQVLDVAMNGHVETHPDFEVPPNAEGFADWLNPPSPFAQIIKSAFGSQLTGDEFHPQSAHWQEVIDAFGSRYRLWQ
ncbi:hypothetical protein J2X16_001687 [Pelomonas aquatica]|uniref:Uncharacterized protein n=1 Tax=Pelomonas aquatica TaxID=431058 RepID=A0ABU1Z7B5_9BURK|nr:hypothetical protein [Pelomonas aquatica]MDR7296348.1 hypothetical protein [Pelomonas aquatica]